MVDIFSELCCCSVKLKVLSQGKRENGLVMVISHCWISPAAQEDRVHSEISGDPACANVYLWHPEGPSRPPGEGAPTQDHLPEHRRDRAGDAGVGLGAHIPEHADPSAVRLLRPQLSLLGARPQQLLWR